MMKNIPSKSDEGVDETTPGSLHDKSSAPDGLRVLERHLKQTADHVQPGTKGAPEAHETEMPVASRPRASESVPRTLFDRA